MRIGNTYSDNKIYRGIKHSDGLPLLAEDLHEFSDTLSEKNRYLLDNIVGSGILNNIEPYTTETGVRLREPAVLNIHGDICVIHNSDNINLASLEDLKSHSSGTIVIVGWYQNITAGTVMKDYGGVMNEDLENDLLHKVLNIQVSSRYQLRWDAVVCEGSLTESSELVLPLRDANGVLTGSSSALNILGKFDYIYEAEVPASMDYTSDTLYIIPLVEYSYDSTNDVFMSLTSYPNRQTSTALLESNTEPQGTFPNGTIWYNPVNREFRTYINGTGFVSNATQMGFVQYQYVNIEATDSHMSAPQNFVYTIDESSVPTIQESDLIRVTYEGLELAPNVDYVLNISTRQLTLLNFTRLRGEKLVLTVTRLVEANDVTSLTGSLIEHINSKASNIDSSHVRLSDSIDSSSGVSDGVAATPKAVRDSHIYTDEITGTRYRLKVSNGAIQLVEV